MCKWLNNFAKQSQPWTWLALRVIASIMFLMHGVPKLFGSAEREAQSIFNVVTDGSISQGMGIFGFNTGLNMLWLAGFIEVVGGVLLIVGLWTRWAALASAVLMVMAYTHAHLGINPLATGGEAAVLYFLIYAAIFAYGPGKYSVDEMWCKKK